MQSHDDRDAAPKARKLTEAGVKLSTRVQGEWIVFYFVNHPDETEWWEVARLRIVVAGGDLGDHRAEPARPADAVGSIVFEDFVVALTGVLGRALTEMTGLQTTPWRRERVKVAAAGPVPDWAATTERSKTMLRRTRRLVIESVFSAAALFVLCDCGGVRPPPVPSPSPSPTPTPMPSPSPLPFPILRIEGGTIRGWTEAGTICCDNVKTPAVDEGLRDGWPGATGAVAEMFGQAGVRFTEVRTGPYKATMAAGFTRARVSEAPGPWSLPPGQVSARDWIRDRALRARSYPAEAGILPILRDQIKKLNAEGVTVQVGLVDNWALVSGWNAYGDDCSVTQGAPPPRYLAWVDAVVSSTWDLQVWYNLGTEGFRCHPSIAWEDGLYNAVKAKLRERYVDRPVGSELWIEHAKDPTRKHYDFATFSGIFEPPPQLEIPSILVEDNGNYHGPRAWKDLAAEADLQGVYVVFWRGLQSDAQFVETIGLTGLSPSFCPGDAPPLDKNKIECRRLSSLQCDGTPMGKDPDWCARNGFPGQTWCPYGTEDAVGWVQRGACEEERGPYHWYVDGARVRSSPTNPLRIMAGEKNDQPTVRLCGSTQTPPQEVGCSQVTCDNPAPGVACR